MTAPKFSKKGRLSFKNTAQGPCALPRFPFLAAACSVKIRPLAVAVLPRWPYLAPSLPGQIGPPLIHVKEAWCVVEDAICTGFASFFSGLKFPCGTSGKVGYAVLKNSFFHRGRGDRYRTMVYDGPGRRRRDIIGIFAKAPQKNSWAGVCLPR